MKPIFDISEADFFNDTVHGILKNYCHKGIRESHSYAWPHLMRNNSLIIIDKDAKVSYLPAISSLLTVTCCHIIILNYILTKQ